MPWWYMVCVVPIMWLAMKPLLKRPWITPNHITLTSFVVALAAAVCICLDRSWAFICAGLLVHISYTLDCTDGMVARMHKMSTPWGAFLDILLDRWKIVLYSLAILWLSFVRYHDLKIALLVAFNMALSGLNVFLSFAVPDLIGAGRWSELFNTEFEEETGLLGRWMRFADRIGIRPTIGDIEADMAAYCLGLIFCGIYGWQTLALFLVASILIHLIPLQLGHLYFAWRFLRRRSPS
jgi:phosphatidylglycerophosphate synthase